MPGRAALGALSLLLFAGCGPDLGECDEALARAVVYDAVGTPYYAGQALVQESCAGSFCHTLNAKGEARKLAPAELDFDVPVVDGAASEDVQRQLQRALSGGLATARDWLEEMNGQVQDGSMPPGDAGKRVPLSWSASDGMGGALPTSRDTLPGVRSEAGKELLRNWLACGAPVVAGTPGVDADVAALGEVLPPADNVEQVQPDWESIHAKVIVPKCTPCHTPNAMAVWPETMLDLTAGPGGAADVLDRIVDQPAWSGGPCSGAGTLVVAGDCDGSVFLEKLRAAAGTVDTCASPMPLAGPALSDAELGAICTWIEAGALP